MTESEIDRFSHFAGRWLPTHRYISRLAVDIAPVVDVEGDERFAGPLIADSPESASSIPLVAV